LGITKKLLVMTLGKIEREHEDLLLNSLAGLVKLHQNNDIYSDKTALNKVNAGVMMLETLLYPYFEKDYHPRQDGNEIENLHYRLRNLLMIAKKQNLVTPKIFTEDIEEVA